MGEYAKFRGQDVKMGTCNAMYYITYDSYKKYTKSGELVPESNHDYSTNCLFRFPFPDEENDGVVAHNDFNRGVTFMVSKSTGIEMGHSTMFFRTDWNNNRKSDAPAIGFSTPCIQTPEFSLEKHDFNKTNDNLIFEVVLQRFIDGELQTVVRCPYCGEMCRLSKEEAKAFISYVFKHRKFYGEHRRRIAVLVYRGYVQKSKKNG